VGSLGKVAVGRRKAAVGAAIEGTAETWLLLAPDELQAVRAIIERRNIRRGQNFWVIAPHSLNRLSSFDFSL
jgi:hypothetical protein